MPPYCSIEKPQPCFFHKNQFELATDEYLLSGEKKMAALCLTAIDKTEQAINLYEEIGDSESYLEVIDILRSRMRKGRRYDQNQIQACYETAEFHYRKKQFDKALTRFLAVNESDGVLKSALLVEGRDEDVLDYFMQVDKSEKGIEFISRKRNLSISEGYLKNLLSRSSYRIIGGLSFDADERILLELLAKLHAGKNPYDLIEIIRTYLASYESFIYVDKAPKAFIDLIIDTHYLNHIFRIISDGIILDKSFIAQFKKRISAQAAVCDDPLLKALAQESFPPTLEMELQGLPIDMHNYLLFSLAPTRVAQALEFLKRHKADPSKIIGFCYSAGLVKEVALLHEEAESYKRAAEIYLENGYHFDALRCYTKSKDFPGMAKTYEKMHRYDDALAVYTKLGKKTAIARMKKKLEGAKYIQKELF